MEQAMAEHNGYGGLKNYADFVDTGWGKAAMIGGGLLVGAGTGAALGATIGSIVPVVGTAVGAAIGTIVGSIAGIFAAPDVESVEKKQTGGLTYDEMTSFAALAAERGYTTADGSLDATAA
jgi:phage tail tape-measure protein